MVVSRSLFLTNKSVALPSSVVSKPLDRVHPLCYHISSQIICANSGVTSVFFSPQSGRQVELHQVSLFTWCFFFFLSTSFLRRHIVQKSLNFTRKHELLINFINERQKNYFSLSLAPPRDRNALSTFH